MSILIDASALVAMATNEADGQILGDRLDDHEDRLCCASGVWESAMAIARKRTVTASEAMHELDLLLARLDVRVVPIGEAEARIAVDAHEVYGRGNSHPARLNMGDCFAYACAKTNAAHLLYKGEDFVHTDLG